MTWQTAGLPSGGQHLLLMNVDNLFVLFVVLFAFDYLWCYLKSYLCW